MLLGDAAHPCTPNPGLGSCMALEDALVLAKSFCIEATPEWPCAAVNRCAAGEPDTRSSGHS